MPYRRLPKTDQARARTLKSVINLEKEYGFNNVPLSFDLLNKAKTQLSLFEHAQDLYSKACDTWQRNNTLYRETTSNVRLYVSHFIQVFNMAIVRGEFKKESRAFYKLPIESNALPELTADENLIEWGENLIEGEMQRLRTGGMSMTNPTIASLRVQYERFKDLRIEQQFRQISIQRTRENFNVERAKSDILIKEIWDAIENHFNYMPQNQRIEECTKCGIIYYYREGENNDELELELFAE
ncbi:MAG: hypothetical protein LBN95_08505 [Prevotellaceae bacterium]|jgi:hypothetical protein|nr:hypothetical protein [Prevotellaceae bacterium]